MTAAQMLAHCGLGIDMARGELRPPRVFVGRLIGPLIRRMALRDDEPMRKNSPTARELVVPGDPGFAVEKARLRGLIERFAAAGSAGCTDFPHAFFGRLKPEEWGILMYKHLDHHLRQFGV
jgi:hypothetical protein